MRAHPRPEEDRTDMQELALYLEDFRRRFEPRLLATLDRHTHRYTPEMSEAVSWTPLGGGKRVRPAVIDLWADAAGGARETEVLDAGVAVELIHSCSLVLDDLPSMDDARTRRGRETCHRRFGLDTAILAANAQLMLAFEVLGEIDGWRSGLEATVSFARAVGLGGMVGGQHVDLHLPADTRDLAALEYIHSHKTGVLFEACAQLGVRLAAGPEELEELARIYARNLGLAFQIKDDLLDATGHAEEMGKDARQDRGKQTFITSLGHHESEEIMNRLLDTARESARGLSRASERLIALCDYVGQRRN